MDAGARKPVETASAVISRTVKARLARASGAMDNASDYGSEDSRFPDARPEKAQDVCCRKELRTPGVAVLNTYFEPVTP